MGAGSRRVSPAGLGGLRAARSRAASCGAPSVAGGAAEGAGGSPEPVGAAGHSGALPRRPRSGAARAPGARGPPPGAHGRLPGAPALGASPQPPGRRGARPLAEPRPRPHSDVPSRGRPARSCPRGLYHLEPVGGARLLRPVAQATRVPARPGPAGSTHPSGSRRWPCR